MDSVGDFSEKKKKDSVGDEPTHDEAADSEIQNRQINLLYIIP